MKLNAKGASLLIEFTKDGKVLETTTVLQRVERSEGAYTIEGNKLTVTLASGGEARKMTWTLIKLTDAEMVTNRKKGPDGLPGTWLRLKDK